MGQPGTKELFKKYKAINKARQGGGRPVKAGRPVKTETGITLTGVNADNYRKGTSNNPPGLTGVFPGGGGKPKGSKVTTAGDIQQTVTDYAKAQGKGLTGGFAAQQPPGPAMDPQQLAAAKSAQETQFQAAGAAMQDKFKQQNPNAPKMPGGIGIQGAPANMPQQIPGSGIAGPQQPTGGGGRGKGGQSPTGSKGGQTRNPYVGGGGGMTPGTGANDGPKGPRPQSGPQPRPNMSRGGKGGQSPIGGGKGGRRPSPSMGRPNPAASPSANTLASRMADGSAGPANPFAGLQDGSGGLSTPDAAPMMKKAPAFKMRSAHNTTFKEMGSSNKKSAPTRKTSTGYKMPGFGKR